MSSKKIRIARVASLFLSLLFISQANASDFFEFSKEFDISKFQTINTPKKDAVSDCASLSGIIPSHKISCVICNTGGGSAQYQNVLCDDGNLVAFSSCGPAQSPEQACSIAAQYVCIAPWTQGREYTFLGKKACIAFAGSRPNFYYSNALCKKARSKPTTYVIGPPSFKRSDPEFEQCKQVFEPN